MYMKSITPNYLSDVTLDHLFVPCNFAPVLSIIRVYAAFYMSLPFIIVLTYGIIFM